MTEWRLRYRGVRGIEIQTIEASDFAEAEAVGRAYCAAHSDQRYAYVQVDGPKVVAGPEILSTGVARDQVGETEAPPDVSEGKPSTAEHAARLARRGRVPAGDESPATSR